MIPVALESLPIEPVKVSTCLWVAPVTASTLSISDSKPMKALDVTVAKAVNAPAVASVAVPSAFITPVAI